MCRWSTNFRGKGVMIGGGCMDICELFELGLLRRDAGIVLWRCVAEANSAASEALRQKLGSELVPRFWFAQPPLLVWRDGSGASVDGLQRHQNRFCSGSPTKQRPNPWSSFPD